MVSLMSRLKATRMVYDTRSIAARMSTKVLQDQVDEREVKLNYLDGKDNGIAVLGLNRPEARNALDRNLVNHLTKALALIRQDDKVRVLIIRSLVPKMFCAGADLKERFKMNENQVEQFVSSLRKLMNDVETMPTPVISAIDGVALGGGLELALATDIRTTAVESKMGLVETRLAIIPGAGGTQRLPRLIGPAKAKELIYSAKIFDGEEAKELGLVNQVVPQNKSGDAAYQSALNIARDILPNGPIGVR